MYWVWECLLYNATGRKENLGLDCMVSFFHNFTIFTLNASIIRKRKEKLKRNWDLFKKKRPINHCHKLVTVQISLPHGTQRCQLTNCVFVVCTFWSEMLEIIWKQNPHHTLHTQIEMLLAQTRRNLHSISATPAQHFKITSQTFVAFLYNNCLSVCCFNKGS